MNSFYNSHNYYKKIIEHFDLILPLQAVYLYKNELSLKSNLKNFLSTCKILKKQSSLQFKLLSSMTAIDFLTRLNRFEINYELVSIFYNFRLRLKVNSIELNNVFFSLDSLYRASIWLEREVWDMYGIFFCFNPDLRRILTDYGFDGFPLRKDFPLTGFLELSYNFIKRACSYDFLEITQTPKNLNNYNLWF